MPKGAESDSEEDMFGFGMPLEPDRTFKQIDDTTGGATTIRFTPKLAGKRNVWRSIANP